MTDEAPLCFIDTTILFYSFVEQDDPAQSQKARELIRAVRPVVSTQVISEVCANLLKKAHMAEDTLAEVIASFYADYVVVAIDQAVLLDASRLRKRHSFSYWDSLIVSAARAGGCKVLYSEDMQHKLVIEQRLTVLNPFL